MKRCEQCDTEVTFWMMQNQPTPFRFKCPHCKTVYRISTPGMKRIVLGTIVLLTVVSLVLGFGGKAYGLYFIIPWSLVIILAGFRIELWLHNYILKNGTFTQIGGAEMDGITEPDTVDEYESDFIPDYEPEPETDELWDDEESESANSDDALIDLPGI